MTDGESLDPVPDPLQTIRDSLLRLQGWVTRPGSLKWSRDGLDALGELVREHDRLTAELSGRRDGLVEALENVVTYCAPENFADRRPLWASSLSAIASAALSKADASD